MPVQRDFSIIESRGLLWAAMREAVADRVFPQEYVDADDRFTWEELPVDRRYGRVMEVIDGDDPGQYWFDGRKRYRLTGCAHRYVTPARECATCGEDVPA